jgi:hypothetical protein
MAKTVQRKTFRWQAHKPLLASALAVAGAFNMVSAVLAEGTAAGTDISNTATATYTDGNPANTFNATSNTVVIKVAEIAGLTAVASPVLDADGGAVEAGDNLTFIFNVTNVGNAATDVFVPGITNFTTTNFTPSATNPVQVFAADGTTLIGTVPAGGGTITSLGGTPIAPNASFVVKVTGTPAAGTAAGSTVGVTLGNTTDNPAIEGTDQTQNQSDNNDAGATVTDLRTVNVLPDSPANGEREAQATASAIFASSVKPLALATVLKTSALTSSGVPAVPTDDRITYGLGLNVESTTPNNLFQPAALEGTPISLNGTTQTRILVSDAIPAQSKLASVSTSLPAGWQAVYSINPAGAAPGSNPLTLAWQTAPPTNLNTVTRIGFVYTGSLGVGTSITGLNFTVVTSGLPATGGTIENIAQVFGETLGDTTNQIIYDESGDSRPNNFTDPNDPVAPNAPAAPDGSDYVPGTDDGIAPETDANGDNQPDTASLPLIDNAGTNTGTGPKGELNVISLTPTTDDILNGTKDTPSAIGPTGDNDDFTNKSTPVPAGLAPTAPFDPAPVIFDNSFSNPASTGFIAQATVQPLSPSQAATAAGKPAGFYGANTDIPNGTIVTITPAVGAPAVYTYNQATGVFTLTSGIPVNVGDVTAGTEIDYTVTVDLPAGTLQLDDVSIPIIAFPDDDPAVSPGYTGETTNNVTIDRLYTGFMRLVKEAQIRAADGTIRMPFTATPTANAAPDEFIEYRISYENISTASVGSGSIALTANNFVVREDGNTAPNNWAQFTTHQQNTTASAGTLRYYTLSADTTPASTADPAAGTPIQKYENIVPTVAPGATGNLQFRRVVD